MAKRKEPQTMRSIALTRPSQPLARHAPDMREAEAMLQAARRMGMAGEQASIEYRCARIEERWEFVLQPDGTRSSGIVVRRGQTNRNDERWNLTTQQKSPRMRRRIAIVTAIAASASLATAALAWTAWPRQSRAMASLVIPLDQPARAIDKHVPTHSAKRPAALPGKAAPAAVPVSEGTDTSPPASSYATPVESRAAVQTAVGRAFASGETESWSDGALEGYVVVSPVETDAGSHCRNTVVLARGDGGNQTFSHRRCQLANGQVVIRDTASGAPQ